MTLRTQTFSGIRWTTFSSLGRASLQIAQVAILARLLAPSEFGLIAVVLAIMAFLQIFADAGISNAIIHFQEISKEQLSSLFWLNVSIGSGLALLLVIVSPWVAHWYQEPLLQTLLVLAAIGLVANSLGQQLRFSAQKELRFAQLAQLELGAAFAGFAAAVILAWAGAGVYALAVAGLINAVTACLLAWCLLARGWRPQPRLRLTEIKPFLSFGAYMIGNNLANTFNAQVDVLLGARLLGAHAIGFYSVPKNLTLNVQSVINPIVTQVGLPVMARAQQDIVLLKRIYLQTMRMTASVNFPIYVAIAFFSPEIVAVLLGSKWLATVPLLRILAVWGLLRSIGNPAGSLLFAMGRADLAFKWNLALLILIGPAVWLGSHFGTFGMTLTVTGLMAALYFPNWYFLIRPLCGAGLGEYSIQLVIPLLASAASGIIGFMLASLIDQQLIRLLLGCVVGGTVYCVISWYCNREWANAMLELTLFKRKSDFN